MKIFPSIVTTKDSHWKEKIKEVDNLGLKEVALFLTCAEEEERKEIYSAILQSGIKSIPFVHLRSDMKLSEIEYFIKKYNTQLFNAHSGREFPIPADWQKYKKVICIENTILPLDEAEIEKWGGLCLDFSHLENSQRTNDGCFEKDFKIAEKYLPKCNHISAIKEQFFLDDEEKVRYSSHTLANHNELDYLKKYPLNYFSDFCAMELENKITDQIAAITYVNNLLKGRDDIIKEMGF